MLGRRAVAIYLSILWIIPIVIISVAFSVGDRESLFTSANENEEVYFTNLRLNNAIFLGKYDFMANFYAPFFIIRTRNLLLVLGFRMSS